MKKLFFFFTIAVAVASCSKPIDCEIDANTVSGSFKAVAAVYQANPSAPRVDYYSVLHPEECDKDDVIVFNLDGTLTAIDAGVKCSPSNDDSATWSLSGNTITIDGEDATIEVLDCDTFVIRYYDTESPDDILKVTFKRV